MRSGSTASVVAPNPRSASVWRSDRKTLAALAGARSLLGSPCPTPYTYRSGSLRGPAKIGGTHGARPRRTVWHGCSVPHPYGYDPLPGLVHVVGARGQTAGGNLPGG